MNINRRSFVAAAVGGAAGLALPSTSTAATAARPAARIKLGNFLEDPYDKLRQIAPRTVFVQAKDYPGGGEWYTLDLDYKRIAKILAEVNYRGYVALEMEGKENPDSAVPKCIAKLRDAFGS